MKRDIELIRKILFKVEEDIDNVAEYNLSIDGYSMEQVAYHCAILHEGGYIHAYEAQYGDDEVYCFGVARLTWEGHNLLDKIREDTVWNKTKEIVKEKALPDVFEVIKSVSTSVLSAFVEGAIRANI